MTEFVGQLRSFKSAVIKVDILDVGARVSIDVVTEYLLSERYGDLNEHANLSSQAWREMKLSANPFIFTIVAFSHFSMLPNWLLRLVYRIPSRLNSSDEVVRSFIKLVSSLIELGRKYPLPKSPICPQSRQTRTKAHSPKQLE